MTPKSVKGRQMVDAAAQVRDAALGESLRRRHQVFTALSSVYAEIYELDYTAMVATELYRTGGTIDLSASTPFPLMEGCNAVVEKILHPDDAALYLDYFSPEGAARRFADPEVMSDSLQVRFLHANGSYRWSSATLIRLQNDEGHLILLSCVRDIDDVVRAQELSDQLHAEEAASRRMRHIIDSLPSGIAIYDLTDGNQLVFGNHQMFEAHGLGGMRDDEREGFFDAQGPQLQAFMGQLRRNGEAGLYDPLTEEMQVTRPDGSRFTNRIMARPVREGEGRLYAYCTTADVTKQVELERQYGRQQDLYQMVLKSTGDVMFEYDIAADTLSTFNCPDLSDGVPASICPFSTAVMTMGQLLSPSQAQYIVTELQRHAVEGGEGTFTFRSGFRRNETSWYRLNFQCVEGQDGRIARIIGLARDVAEEVKLAEELETESRLREDYHRRAAVDSVTGVMTRWALKTQVENLLEEGAQGAFVIFDLDNFKQVNDTLGHQTGDLLLGRLGAMLAKMFRFRDAVGRLGGDEFVAFLVGVQDEAIIDRMVQRLITCVSQLNDLPELAGSSVGVSAGVSRTGVDGQTFDQLYHHADEMLYKAKTQGKNCYFICNG